MCERLPLYPAQSYQHLRIGVGVAVLVCSTLAGVSAAASKSWNADAGVWGTAGNWTPFGAPNATDDVSLGNLAGVENCAVSLDGFTTIASLTITDGVELRNNHRTLQVNGQVLISGSNAVSPVIYFSHMHLTSVDGLSLSAENLRLTDKAWLSLDSAFARVEDVFDLGTDCALTGHGYVNLMGNGARSFINGGRIEAQDGNIEIYQYGNGLIDLDGDTGTGSIYLNSVDPDAAPYANVSIHGTSLHDDFNGEIQLISNGFLNMSLIDGWVAAPGSVIRTYGWNGGEPAHIQGGEFTLGGELLGPSSYASTQIEAKTTIRPTAVVDFGDHGHLRFTYDADILGGTFTIGQDAHIDFDGSTYLAGGEFTTFSNLHDDGAVSFNGPTTWNGHVTVHGVARQVGNATVAGATVIDADVFDMDGVGLTVWNVNGNLVVNAGSIDTEVIHTPDGTLSDYFDSRINIANGFLSRLTLNLNDPNHAWTMGGEMNLAGDNNFFITRVGGSPMRMSGELNMSGVRSQIAADTTFTKTGAVSFALPTTVLRMTGYTQVAAGANFIGQGTLQNGPTGEMILDTGVSLSDVGLVNEGLLDVATGAGIALVDRFQNTDDGTWRVQIGGHLAGAGHDLLLVGGGEALLDGLIQVDLIDLGSGVFVPQIGDEFTVLTALNGVDGVFLNNPASLANGLTYEWSVIYGSNEVVLRLDQIVPEPASLAMLLFGTCMFARFGRRSQRPSLAVAI